MRVRSKRAAIVFLGALLSLATLGSITRVLDRSVDVSASTSLTSRYCSFHFSSDFNVSCYDYWTHGKRRGFKVPLALISRKSEKEPSSRDLLLQVPGGPGQGDMASGDAIEAWVDWLESNQLDVDLLLYEPRGTARDAWRCQNFHAALAHTLALNISYEHELASLSEVLLECLDEYSDILTRSREFAASENSGLALFSSYAQAEDIREITQALGYNNVHLWGTSYGSRLALLAARYDNVKTLILDSPYAFEQGRYSDWPFLHEHSFTLHEQLYSRWPEKKRASYRALFRAAEALLNVEGLSLLVDHWQNNSDVAFLLNASRLRILSFFVLYDSSLYELYYRGLDKFVESGVISQDLMVVVETFVNNQLDKSFSSMTYFATECADNERENENKIMPLIERYPHLYETLLIEWRYDVCHIFDFGSTKFVHGATYSEKPTLIFSGQFDPVTPHVWAKKLDGQLANSRFFTGYNLGHSVLLDMSCDWHAIVQFMRTQSLDVNISCENDVTWP